MSDEERARDPRRGTLDRKALAAGLNAVEGVVGHSDAIAARVEAAWRSPRGSVIGITGPPGVGKSTLSGRLVAHWRAMGLAVCALCVDPSSRRGGALLGDRLRMRLDGHDEGVFVRSMAARGRLGGLAPRAFEAVTLMRAAADVVLVETVGVGQSEVEVAGLADAVAVVIQPGSGDALQFLKAGLMEVFDLLVVNKADLGPLATAAARELRAALRVQGRREVPVHLVSAEGTGADGTEALAGSLLALADAVPPERRQAAMRALTIDRFRTWYGERVVRASGGVEALEGALAGAAPEGPGTAWDAVVGLVPQALR